MPTPRSLIDLIEVSAKLYPDKTAVVVPGGSSITYSELDRLSDSLRDRLVHIGVAQGDRVGFRLHKSIESVACIFGILKAGAAYVPVDADSPVSRAAFILSDCGVKAVVLEKEHEADMMGELDAHGARPVCISLDLADAVSGSALTDALDESGNSDPAISRATSESDLAYLLYTSGSTGTPKGVALTHGNALSFVNWCSETFEFSSADNFSSHAPFHFDLSILDIFVCIQQGATLTLIDEALGKDPTKLAQVIADQKISVWYSTPSILSLLANYGRLHKHMYGSLRIVFFAGEVFPIPQYTELLTSWDHPRYVNLYGPTETNVCTWYEVPREKEVVANLSSFPIGNVCEPNLARVVDEDGKDVGAGNEGELVIAGPNVMQGYWNRKDLTEGAFLRDCEGPSWYKTGDIVKSDDQGRYVYVSRRDRMVKRRGYRVELGEIEVALSKHPNVREAAAVAVSDEDAGLKVCAYVVGRDGEKLSIIAMKQHSSRHLPPYMIPDVFVVLEQLPRTSTDKINYQSLISKAP